MKIFLMFLIAALSGLNCAVINAIGDDFDGTTEALEILTTHEVTVEDVKSRFDLASSLIPRDKSFLSPLIQSLIRSVDRQCVVDKYKEKDMMNIFPSEDIEEADITKISVFAMSAILCSSKFDIFNEFQFELLMSFRFLYKAFINDPEFEEYADMFTCANKYAVEHKLLDPISYNIKYEVADDKTDQCNEWTTIAEQMIEMSTMRSGDLLGPKCAKDTTQKAIDLVLKYLLMIQVDLNEAQKIRERANYVKDSRDYADHGLKCYTEMDTGKTLTHKY